ncbi:hypothetical protein [Xanthomarina sp. F2636L]|uniref:hypothetical protein n=1 Tax=Xanthomarina sp. F2636L TaxID=2996018 RepID=UPI00225E1F66|nr:hypothetical protein [Xanthomarina sp. F2636L]MCX7549888.1 hypothetical protein [Xanthomarina sp. F2636L]
MSRPKIKIRKNNIDKGIEALTFALILISAILIGVYYNQLPEKLPIYFNWPSKDNDGLGTKDLLWISPIVFGIIGIVLYKLNQYPWLFNYPSEISNKNIEYNYKMSTQMLRILGLFISIMCLLITIASILNGLGNDTDYNKYLYPFLPILFIALPIIYLIKILMHKKIKYNKEELN